jgi:hypothetical protein
VTDSRLACIARPRPLILPTCIASPSPTTPVPRSIAVSETKNVKKGGKAATFPSSSCPCPRLARDPNSDSENRTDTHTRPDCRAPNAGTGTYLSIVLPDFACQMLRSMNPSHVPPSVPVSRCARRPMGGVASWSHGMRASSWPRAEPCSVALALFNVCPFQREGEGEDDKKPGFRPFRLFGYTVLGGRGGGMGWVWLALSRCRVRLSAGSCLSESGGSVGGGSSRRVVCRGTDSRGRGWMWAEGDWRLGCGYRCLSNATAPNCALQWRCQLDDREVGGMASP